MSSPCTCFDNPKHLVTGVCDEWARRTDEVARDDYMEVQYAQDNETRET